MKGWGAQDDFQAQIDANNNDAVARVRSELEGTGTTICEDCDEPIDPRRKSAYPSCTRCIRCQTIHEGT